MNVASTAFASDCETAQPLHPKALANGGLPGVWLSEKDANRVFFVLGDCVPKWKQVIVQQEKVIDLSAQVIRTSSAAHDAKDALIAQLGEHNDFLRARAEDAESGIDPALAFMGGATVAAVIAVVTLIVKSAVE